MTSRSDMEQTVRAAYAARVRGDVAAAMTYFTDDAVFCIHGRGTGIPGLCAPVVGKPAITEAMGQLVAGWRFDDWKEHSLLVDGDKVALHWTARATFTPTNKSEVLNVFDVITFRDGKFADFHQSVDTAMLMQLSAA